MQRPYGVFAMLQSENTKRKNFMNLGLLGLFFSAILLFGAYTSSLSQIYAFAFSVWVVFSVLFLGLGKPDYFTCVLLCLWLLFFLIHFLFGYVRNAPTQYFLSFLAVCIFWSGSKAISHPKQLKLIWTTLLVMGLLFSSFALAQHIFTPDQTYFIPKKYHLGRLTGSFISSNTAATLLGVFVLMSLARMLRTYFYKSGGSKDKGSHIPVLAITSFIFTLTALLLTASRAGIAATFVSTFVFSTWFFTRLYRQKPQKPSQGLWRQMVYAVLFIGSLFLLWQSFGSDAQTRYAELLKDTKQRTDLAVATWEAIQLKPVFGHGLGSFESVKLLGADEQTIQNVLLHETVHNFYLQTLLQAGGFGLVLIGTTYAITVTKILHAVTRKKPNATFMMAVLCASLLVCLHGLFDYALEVPAVMLLHLWLLGVAYGLHGQTN